MEDKISMRDSFWNRIYDIARKDRDVMLVAGDMGAPSIDKFREKLWDQYLNVGIAEHSMIACASGLAKEGKKPFTYAIGPFITSRCHEFTKLNGGLMGIPINLVGVGAGSVGPGTVPCVKKYQLSNHTSVLEPSPPSTLN